MAEMQVVREQGPPSADIKSRASAKSNDLLRRLQAARAVSPDSAIESSVSHPKARSAHRGDRNRNRSPSSRHSRHSHRSRGSRHSHRSRHSRRSKDSHSSGGRRRGGSREKRRAIQERQDRHEIILELDKWHIEFTGDEETYELEHLLDRVLTNQQLGAKVAFMKTGLKLLVTAIELAANRFAPQLGLKGWADSLTKVLDGKNYDNLMEQLYRKIWSKGPPNPWSSLAIIIFGSAFLHCVGAGVKGMPASAGGMLSAFMPMLGSFLGGSSSAPISSPAVRRREEKKKAAATSADVLDANAVGGNSAAPTETSGTSKPRRKIRRADS